MSSTSRREMTLSRSPSWSDHVQNFSAIHAHDPTGESTSEYPIVCGLVA